MPIDPRIALMGNPDRTDVFGAFNTSRAAEQTFRQNQMAMQAAETAAQRNMMARQRAAAVDPANRPQVNAFVNEVGADVAAPYLEAWNNVGGMFRAEAEEDRAAGKYTREARGEDRGFMQSALAAVYNNPSDESIAAVRAQALAAGIPEADFDAYASRFLAAPVEQRRSLLANELATSEEGRKVLTTFAPEWERENRGGTINTIQTNPLVPGATPPAPATVTADPNRQQLVQDADGNWVSVNPNTNLGAPVTLPGGAPVTGQTRRNEDDPAVAAAAAARAAAPARLEGAQNLVRLIDDATANTNYFTAGLGSVTAVIPGTPAADLAGTMESIKSNLAFDRLQQMRDESRTGGALGQIVLRELDMLASVWASTQQSQSPGQLRENLGVLKTRAEALAAAYEAMVADGGGGASAGGGSAPQRIWDRYGVAHVVRNGQWVPE